MSSNLQIITGDVTNIEDVKSVLQYQSQQAPIIFSGIGMRFNDKHGVDKEICQKGTKVILSAVDSIYHDIKPFCVFVSTIGTGLGDRDIPLVYIPLYHTLLKIPLTDKAGMERLIRDAVADGRISGFCMPRPTLFATGEARGVLKIRAGIDDKQEIGYTISREDVGRWMYEELVVGDRTKWTNKSPSLTY